MDRVALWAVRTVLVAQRAALWLGIRLAFGPQQLRASPRNILVLRTGALGDSLFALPAMAVLRARFPNATIVFLTAPSTDRSVLSQIDSYADNETPWVAFVVPAFANRAVSFRMGALRATVESIRQRLNGFQPDAIFVLPTPGERFLGLAKKLAFLRLIGLRAPVFGWRTRATYSLLRGPQARAGMLTHKVVGALRAVTECSFVGEVADGERYARVSLDSGARDWAASQIRGLGWDKVPLVAIAPGSIQAHKQWPLEKFIQVARSLVADGAALVVVGTAADGALAETILKEVPGRSANLCGLELTKSAALLERCRVLVANDGGAVHLATVVGCPVVAIGNGIEYPGSVDPWATNSTTVRFDVPCAPCYSMTHCPLGTRACVVGVDVANVIRETRARLATSSA